MSQSAHILCLETSSTVCSVCVTANDKVLTYKETNNGYSHSESLHVFIQDVLKEANLTVKQISAVAVSKGPGSYTGLRIGVSSAKGLCYALQIPLISIDTLQSMAYAVASKKAPLSCGEGLGVRSKQEDMLYCPMLDARRMEVYCAVYNRDLETIIPVNALVLDEKSVEVFTLNKPICFFGDGMPKAKDLLQSKGHSLFIEAIFPSSLSMAALAFKKFGLQQFEDVAYFEPFYLKEFFTTAKK
ncbi:MAG: tRNA (adenosine(37)-N6)-threonylcarbamoyltransferase complex dimerization subunit type 1 TsaB [Bacteroidia bacterium]